LQNPQTWGEHIKKRRFELGLTQALAAQVIGVTESTITYWERQRTEPMLWAYPKIIEFLGYNPDINPTKTLGQKIKEYRRIHGIAQEMLARQIGIDPSTLSRLERDQGQCQSCVLKKVSDLFKV
jgi:DNA-binding XRE family transcriptional regulator